MGSNRFWHIVSVVKEQSASLSSRVASLKPTKLNTYAEFVNADSHLFYLFHSPPRPAGNIVKFQSLAHTIAIIFAASFRTESA